MAQEFHHDVSPLISPTFNRQALAPAIKNLVGMRVGRVRILVPLTATNNTSTFHQLRVEQG